MSFLSASAARAAVCVIALSGAGLWALHAMDAKADPPPMDDSSPCAEGRALFAAKLAYLEARISPEPSQEDAWRSFENAMRSSASEVDRTCVEELHAPPLRRCGRAIATDGETCGRHAGNVWRHGESLCGDRSQSDDCATRHPFAEHRPFPAIPRPLSPAAWRTWLVASSWRSGSELWPGRVRPA